MDETNWWGVALVVVWFYLPIRWAVSKSIESWFELSDEWKRIKEKYK